MVEIGYTLSSEDHGPTEMVRFAAAAQELGIRHVWASDHFHPWLDVQGNSPFVWSVLGAIAAASPELHLGTGVTCPTMRIHPAIVAHAVATTAVLAGGKLFLGVGSGENLNEHILGDRWPTTDERLAMLEEAVEVMRKLWRGGVVFHEGEHYVVEHARLYNVPDKPTEVYVSAFGPKAAEVAARIGDGFVGTAPSPDVLKAYRDAGGQGPAVAGAKCVWAPDEATGRKRALERWPNMGVPGELAQELRVPAHFEQVSAIVRDEDLGPFPAGDDPQVFVDNIREYAEAGYDRVYFHHIGEDQEDFLRFFTSEVIPRVG